MVALNQEGTTGGAGRTSGLHVSCTTCPLWTSLTNRVTKLLTGQKIDRASVRSVDQDTVAETGSCFSLCPASVLEVKC
jgi:hypothetical protein